MKNKFPFFFSLFSLLFLIFARWADNLSSQGSDGQVRQFEHPFVQACFMFMGEMLCLLAFKGFYYYYRRKNVSKRFRFFFLDIIRKQFAAAAEFFATLFVDEYYLL